MIIEIISIILGVILLGAAQYGYGGGGFDFSRLIYLIDIPSLIILLIFTVPMLLRGGRVAGFYACVETAAQRVFLSSE